MVNKWIDFTYSDPHKYNSNDFVFLVHAIQLGSPISINGKPLDRKYGMGYKMFRDIKAKAGSMEPDYDLVENPHDVAKMTLIDCSLIGRGKYKNKYFEQLYTWNNVGLILAVPAENILISGKEDLNTSFINPEEEIELHRNDDKGDPWDLLLNGIGKYNHVAVTGKSNKIKVVGVFYNEWKLEKSPQGFRDFYEEWARKISQNANVPLITIPVQKEALKSTANEHE